jgi:methyl-accepting chemotaxis protein
MSFINNIKVKTKLNIILVVLGIMPVLVMFAIFTLQKQELQSATSDQITALASNINETIDRNLFERYGDVQAFGFNTAAYNPENWRKPSSENPLIVAINNYVRAYGLYPVMILVDTEGKPLATNTVDAKGNELKTSFIYEQNFSKEKWFTDVMAGKFLEGRNGLTGTAVQQPARNDVVAKVTGSDGFVIPFSAQVKNTEGKLIGVWVNFADMGLVEDIIGTNQAVLKSQGLTNTDLMLIDPNGTILVDYDVDNIDSSGKLKRDFDTIGVQNLVKSGLKSAAEATQGRSGYVDEFNSDVGENMLMAYSHSDGAYDYTGLGWSMIAGVSYNEAYKAIYSVNSVMIYNIIGSLIFSLIIGYMIGGAAAKPLLTSAAEMRKLAEGDYTTSVTGSERGDEFGLIAKSLVVFKENGQQMNMLKVEQVKQEERAKADKKKAMNDLANNFEASVGQIVGAVAAAATELNANAESLTAISDQTSRQTASAASATEQASVSVQTVASSAEELTASINEISRQVVDSTQMTREAVDQVKRTDATVSGLVEASAQIGEVVSLIKDIADQTNLLALNATIEAARAGEAGKGFAVVASEVKNLASQTAKATEEISSRIETMQGSTQSAAEAIRSIGAIIERISSVASGISAAVEEQSAATREIANSTQQVSAGTAEVSSSVASVSQGANEARNASDEVLSAAKELSVQAEELKKEMANFLEKVRHS